MLDGLRADVVTLALAYDIDAIAGAALLPATWQKRLPTTVARLSTCLSGAGNPQAIQNWPDLSRLNIRSSRRIQNPAARWNYLAAWGFAEKPPAETRARRRALRGFTGTRRCSVRRAPLPLRSPSGRWACAVARRRSSFGSTPIPGRWLRNRHAAAQHSGRPPVALVDESPGGTHVRVGAGLSRIPHRPESIRGRIAILPPFRIRRGCRIPRWRCTVDATLGAGPGAPAAFRRRRLFDRIYQPEAPAQASHDMPRESFRFWPRSATVFYLSLIILIPVGRSF